MWMWRSHQGLQKLISIQIISNSYASTSTGLPQEIPPSKQEIAEIAEKIPIEKRSLMRGFSINKFEKDFIIYPEYGKGADIEKIKKFVEKLGNNLDKALATSNMSAGLMPPEVKEVLLEDGIFAATVPKEFGGMNLSQKDLSQIAECLGGRDLSTFTSFSHVRMAASLISQFGTTAQKDRYLPGIAAGKWRPTICWQEDTAMVKQTRQVFSAQGKQKRLCAVKVNVVDAADANLFIVFANQQSGDMLYSNCFILEQEAITDSISSIRVEDQVKTSGLQRCNFSTVVFDNVPIENSCLLGESKNNIETMLEELTYTGKTLCGAATVGFLKKLLGELCTFANMEVKGNMRLSDSHPIQKAIFELGILTYVLESISYYIAGLNDEDLFLMQDIENSIIQRFSNRAIRQAIMTITDVAGICSTDMELPFDQMIKDSLAVMSLSEPDLQLVRRITIPAIEYYVNHYGGMKKFMRTSSLTKMLTGRDDFEAYLNPKFVHFIAEHVHPSLGTAARNLEFSISRVDKVIDQLVTERGAYINTDYEALQNISTIMENNLGMIASIARASRSYSIGVRNSDLELEWTHIFCWKASEETKKIIMDTLDSESGFGLIGKKPKLHEAAKQMLQLNGYCLESPIEKNW